MESIFDCLEELLDEKKQAKSLNKSYIYRSLAISRGQSSGSRPGNSSG